MRCRLYSLCRNLSTLIVVDCILYSAPTTSDVPEIAVVDAAIGLLSTSQPPTWFVVVM